MKKNTHTKSQIDYNMKKNQSVWLNRQRFGQHLQNENERERHTHSVRIPINHIKT